MPIIEVRVVKPALAAALTSGDGGCSPLARMMRRPRGAAPADRYAALLPVTRAS